MPPDPSHLSQKLLLPGKLKFGATEFNESLFVDCGADNCFINQALVSRFSIPIVPLVEPIKILLADGNCSSSGLITHETLPIQLYFGRHIETISFLVTSIAHSIILGYNWLRVHNPKIDWISHSAEFASDHCLTHCVSTAYTHVGFPLGGFVAKGSELKADGFSNDIQGLVSPNSELKESLFHNDSPGTLEYSLSFDNEISTKVKNSYSQAPNRDPVSSISVIDSVSFASECDVPCSAVGVAFIQVIQDRLKIVSLDSVHSQVYPFLDSMSPEVKPVPERFLRDYSDVFSETNADILPVHRPYDCEIPVNPGSEIPYGKIYNLTEEEAKTLEDYVNENLEKGFIRHSSSPAGAPCFFVKKKDGSLRLCVDYRGLNKVTVKNRYPLPLISDLIRTLSKAKIYTALDLRGAYNLVRIKPGDEWKTAFRTRFGHFEYLVMPFGLTNAPAIFQHMMNDIFRDLLDRFVIVYLDDILIYSNTPEEHEEHVRIVLDRLRKFRLYCKSEKCRFFVESIPYLGYVISPSGVSMDVSKVKAIQDWPSPRNVHDVQIFLGFANFYRRFIHRYADLTKPLTSLLKKNVTFVWNDEAQIAFEKLKVAFTTSPVLAHPDSSRPYVVETDASDFALAAILSQYDDLKVLRPVAFHSRQLLQPERNYDVYDKELLAIVEAFKIWRHFLQGSQHQVTVLSDHKNLEYFMTSRQLSRRQARWSLLLSDYDFVLTHRPGCRNGKADLLSRRSDYLPEGGSKGFENFQQIIKPTQILANLTTENDSLFLSYVREATVGHEMLSRLGSSSAFELRDGLLFKDGLLFVPNDDLRLKVLKQKHDHPTSGHFGAAKTLELISRDFWWPKLYQTVSDYVASCECARAKASRHKPYGLLQPLPIPEQPWSSLSTDFIVELPPSEGYNAISVWVCRLTKMAHFIPCTTNISADGLVSLFTNNIFKIHGLPKDIVSDRGPQFISKFWKAFCSNLNIKANLSTSYHPQSDGQTERVNQILEQYLRCFLNHYQDNWCSLLPIAEFAYNNSVNSSIGFSPFFANYGFHPRADHLPQNPQNCSLVDRAENLKANLEELKEQLKKSQDRYKRFADENRLEKDLEVNTMVYLNSRNISTRRPSKKLDFKKLGPFKIIEKIGKAAYRLELPATMKIHNVFHVSLLEPLVINDFSEVHEKTLPAFETVDEDVFEVEAILDSVLKDDSGFYLVKWKGYDSAEATWEPYPHLKNARACVKKFHKLYPSKPGPWKMKSLGARPKGGDSVTQV